MNLREMFGLRVPIISVVIGEGGSGGALAIGCSNWNLIMEHSVYYVASPEACAAILWKSRDKAATVCSRMHDHLLLWLMILHVVEFRACFCVHGPYDSEVWQCRGLMRIQMHMRKDCSYSGWSALLRLRLQATQAHLSMHGDSGDPHAVPQATEALRITSTELLKFKVMDDVISEPLGGAHSDPMASFPSIKDAIMNVYHNKCASRILSHSSQQSALQAQLPSYADW